MCIQPILFFALTLSLSAVRKLESPQFPSTTSYSPSIAGTLSLKSSQPHIPTFVPKSLFCDKRLAFILSRSFKDITLKEIGAVTSFTRTSIYNYFQTKEEIFLALFEREYDRWNEALINILNENEALTKRELAEKIAESLSERGQLLKLLSMNNFDMEANSRTEILVSFKRAYGGSMRNVALLLEKFVPGMNVTDIQNFIYRFFPFMFGIYPYTAVTEKQREAMKEAGVDYVYQSVYELTLSCIVGLLGA